VQAVRMAVERGWFPGGTLFVALWRYGADSIGPELALDSLLQGLGAQDDMPLSTDDRITLYRKLLEEHNRRVLILVDDVANPEQVGALVSGLGPHRMIVTSRRDLPGLATHVIDLQAVPLDDATKFLDVKLRAANPQDTRISAAPRAAESLAAYCGFLPLALSIVVAILVDDSTRSVADLVDNLAAASSGRPGVDAPENTVGAVFETSYRSLTEDSAHLFRMISSHPSPELSTEAAAVLAGQTVAITRSQLEGLAQANLVLRGSAPHRWRMHDLIYRYSASVS
jgi:hypothetical protein